MSERQGVEIDYCPECRGIWLDRGELDKILERVQAEDAAFAERSHGQSVPQRDGYGSDSGYSRRERDYGYRERDARHGGYDTRYGKRRKKSPFEFLGDIFD